MNEHRCVSCGDIIPYGRDICWGCEHGYTPDKTKYSEEKDNDNGAFERTEDEVSAEE